MFPDFHVVSSFFYPAECFRTFSKTENCTYEPLGSNQDNITFQCSCCNHRNSVSGSVAPGAVGDSTKNDDGVLVHTSLKRAILADECAFVFYAYESMLVYKSQVFGWSSKNFNMALSIVRLYRSV